MDVRINSLLMKINDSGVQQVTKDTVIQENKIKDMILFLMIKYNKDYSLTREKITSEIINLQQGTEGTRQENKKLSASYHEEPQTVSECTA
jgi:hypothetical protein